MSCAVTSADGLPCRSASVDGAPFPICVKHIAEVMRFVSHSQRGTLPPVRIPRVVKESVVYYLQVGKLIKIGTTTDLDTRMKAYPPDSVLLATEPGGRDVELRRHNQMYKSISAGREWFRVTHELVGHINSLRETPVQIGQLT